MQWVGGDQIVEQAGRFRKINEESHRPDGVTGTSEYRLMWTRPAKVSTGTS
jgi:hypothetical protein